MSTRERRNKILTELSENKKVYVKDLATKLEVSEMTIRRDLARLSEMGIATIVHGGAVFNEGGASILNVTLRERQMQQEKNRLGQYCSDLIHEGNAVFLDCGSTVMNIADALLNRQNIAVITNSLHVLNILSNAKDIQLIALPGIYEGTHRGFYGDMTQRMLKKFRIDIAFMGTNAISAELGTMTSLVTDQAFLSTVLEVARKKILVTDHTKINKELYLKICDINTFDKIITDKKADENFINKVRRRGVEVVQV